MTTLLEPPPLCRYCSDFAASCRTSGPRASRTFRCAAHRFTDDDDASVVNVFTRPTYAHLDLDGELIPAMRAAWQRRVRQKIGLP